MFQAIGEGSKYKFTTLLRKMNSSLAAAGGVVSMATSTDTRYPPEAVIDGNPSTFWMTTGLFPQELIITLPSAVGIGAISTKTANVRKVIIEASNQAEGNGFDMILEKELSAQDGSHAQSEAFRLEGSHSVRRLKVILAQGYDHFAAVYSVQCTAST